MLIKWETERGSLELRDPFRLRTTEGLGVQGVIVNMESAPYQDGAYLTDTLFEPRMVSLEVIVFGNNAQQAERRRRLAKLFNPKLDGTLTVTADDGNVYRLQGRAEEVTFPARIGRSASPSHQMAMISIIAPDPYFVGEGYQLVLQAISGGWSFPFLFGIAWGEVEKFRDINNTGDVPVPIFITAHGAITNFTVQNVTTGETIEIVMVIEEGERLEIDTGEKTVYLVETDGTRVNAFPNLSIDSTLFLLKPGKNVISYSVDVEGAGAGVTFAYKLRYVGI